MNVKDLFRCMAVNKKMRAIANDKSLWISWHLTGEIPAELLKQILTRGCQYLSLYSCKILNTARFEENYDLKYLNIYNCSVGTFDPFYCLADLSNSSHNLEKFSFWCSTISHKFQCLNFIRNNYGTLRVLFLEDYRFRHIVAYCSELVELNISCLPENCLTKKCVKFICDNLTTKIRKLDVTGQRNFGDEELKTLLKRCNKLTEFAFQFSSVTDASVKTIIDNLSETLIKINCTGTISKHGLIELSSMPKLKVVGEELQIASPYQCFGFHQGPSGFWEIKGKPQNFI